MLFCPLPLWPDQSESWRQAEINEVPSLSYCHLGVNASDEALPFIKAADNATGAETLLPDMMNLRLFCWSAQEQAYTHTRSEINVNKHVHFLLSNDMYWTPNYL